jgi:hypothetical protein
MEELARETLRDFEILPRHPWFATEDDWVDRNRLSSLMHSEVAFQGKPWLLPILAEQ